MYEVEKINYVFNSKNITNHETHWPSEGQLQGQRAKLRHRDMLLG